MSLLKYIRTFFKLNHYLTEPDNQMDQSLESPSSIRTSSGSPLKNRFIDAEQSSESSNASPEPVGYKQARSALKEVKVPKIGSPLLGLKQCPSLKRQN